MNREFMNIIINSNKQIYKYDGIWRNNKNMKEYDSNNIIIPWPTSYKKSWQKDIFINILKNIEKQLILDNKFIQYNTKNIKDCLFGDYEKLTTKLFYINNHYWNDGLLHYIIEHNIKPSDEFIDMIMNIKISKNEKTKILNIPSMSMVKHGKRYIKLRKNQILIMDALMKHGSYSKKYHDKDNNIVRYSEHSGLLDFKEKELEKIVVSTKKSRIDDDDEDIYLPENMVEAYDYEYFFHTHPATPKPGGRAEDGILYEFPSISDVFHFIEHYNNGTMQGSIIIAAEGMYIIRKYIVDDKKIIIKDEDKIYDKLEENLMFIQQNAIKKYGTKFDTNKFYSVIAQDDKYITLLNDHLHKYGIHIEYYPRQKNKFGHWFIGSVYLPVYVIQ